MSTVLAVLGELPSPVLPLVVTAVLAVESGTTVGLVIPGTTVALAAGAATASLPVMVVAAAVGVLLGGQVGRVAGRHRDATGRRDRRAVSGPAAWVTEAFRRRPTVGLLAGPWLSCGRVIAPRLAGRTGCGRVRFALLHGPSAAGWAASMTVAGHLLGVVGRSHVVAGFSVAALAVATAGVLAWFVRRRRPDRTSPPVDGIRAMDLVRHTVTTLG